MNRLLVALKVHLKHVLVFFGALLIGQLSSQQSLGGNRTLVQIAALDQLHRTLQVGALVEAFDDLLTLFNVLS